MTTKEAIDIYNQATKEKITEENLRWHPAATQAVFDLIEIDRLSENLDEVYERPFLLASIIHLSKSKLDLPS